MKALPEERQLRLTLAAEYRKVNRDKRIPRHAVTTTKPSTTASIGPGT